MQYKCIIAILKPAHVAVCELFHYLAVFLGAKAGVWSAGVDATFDKGIDLKELSSDKLKNDRFSV